MYENNGIHDVAEVNARLDDRINVEKTDIEGEPTIIVHMGYGSRHLFEIERFVIEIVEDSERSGFAEELSGYSTMPEVQELLLGTRYYRKINGWLERYSDIYQYSARVGAFYDVCKSMGLIGPQLTFRFRSPVDMELGAGIRYMDLFNAIIVHVRARCHTREFKERERLREMNAERNKQNVLALEEAMFCEKRGRSRWLILSLTLRYKPRYRQSITLENIQGHRDRFLAARRFNKLFSGIKNYVWAIEQGEKIGLHLHVILFYSADSNHDEYIARQLGEYWVNVVTGGEGDYWNSNDGKLKKGYETRGHGIGVGQVNWDDCAKRNALRINLAYLAKTEQYLMIKASDGIHTFGMGHVPHKVKSGRPRARWKRRP